GRGGRGEGGEDAGEEGRWGGDGLWCDRSRVEPAQQTGQHRQRGHGLTTRLAGRQVPLVLGSLGRRERAKDVRSIVERVQARHRVTPISSSTSLSARTA